MASIREIQNQDGSISKKIQICMGRREDGRQIMKSKTFRFDPKKSKAQNEKEFDKVYRSFLEKCEVGSVDGDRRSFESYANEWLENYAKVELEKTTYRRYKNGLEHTVYPRIGYMKLSDIRPSTIQTMLNDMRETGYDYGKRKGKYSDESCRTIKIIVSSVMSSAVADGLITQNPCILRQRKHKKVQRKEVRCFTIEQAMRFLDIINEPIPIMVPEKIVTRHGKQVRRKAYQQGTLKISLKYQTAFTITIFSGVRREELLGLKWEDVDFEKNLIDINKAVQYTSEDGIFIKTPKSSAGYRKIYLPDICMNLLKKLRRQQQLEILKQGTKWEGSRIIDENFCFTKEHGKVMFPSTLRLELVRVLKTYNRSCTDKDDLLPVSSFHDLRHTYASVALAQGSEAPAVAKILGHSDASITLQIYAHSSDERGKEVSRAVENALLKRASG